MHPQTVRRVVVGVDGAPRTVAALRWAATEALRRDAELVAVHAWGNRLRPASYAPVGEASTPAEAAERAAELLHDAVRAAFGAAPPVPVPEVVDEQVVPALPGQAREAELPVVTDEVRSDGARPTGGDRPPTLA